MSYEYMQGMGTIQDDARAAYARGTELYNQRNFSAAYEQYARANSLVPSSAAQSSMGVCAVDQGNCALAIAHFERALRNPTAGWTMSAPNRASYEECQRRENAAGLAPAPDFGTSPGGGSAQTTTGTAAQPAAEKQAWWTGDVEGMFSSFLSKVGIGQQAANEAESVAREEGQNSGATSINQVVPNAGQQPVVNVEGDTATPWYVQYAPHMVIGGLGLGAAVITLVLVMRKR